MRVYMNMQSEEFIFCMHAWLGIRFSDKWVLLAIILIFWYFGMQKFSAILLLRLAFQSLGVVYGDLGTSPLYVFYNTFPDGINDTEEVIGALSLIIYSLTLIPLLKYVFIVCRANDNGQGKPILNSRTYRYVIACKEFDIQMNTRTKIKTDGFAIMP